MFFNVAGGAPDPASVFVHTSALAHISIPAENDDRMRIKGTPHCGQAVTGGSSIRWRNKKRFEQKSDCTQYSAIYS
jgi:hypothetical protein